MVMEHAKFSPSSFPARGKCARWIPQPEKEETPDSPTNRGRLGHLAVQSILACNNDKNVPEECTHDEIGCAQWAANYIKKNTSSSRLVEQKVTIDLDFEPWTFGTADVIDPPLRGKIIVVDYKAGAYSKDYLLQVMAYALGAMQEHDCEKARLLVLYGIDRKSIIVDTTYEECESTVLEMKDRCEHPEDYDYVPCEFCEWCGSHLTCEALTDKVQKVAAEYEDNFDLEEYHSSQITDPNQMAKGLYLASIVDKWAKSFKQHAKQMAMDGVEIPGYELSTRTTRSINDEDVPDVLRLSEFSSADFIACCDVKPAKIEKKLADLAGLKSVTKKIKDKYNSLFGTLTQNKESIILQKQKSKKKKEKAIESK
jgi:CRISPR/Cas system-associated exonuclease Cas4 (RecB family)